MSQDPEWMQIYINVVVTTLQKSSENKIITVLGEMMEKYSHRSKY